MGLGRASIRKRIYVGFGVVVALLAIQVGVGLRGLDRIEGQRRRIVEQYDPPSQAAQDLEKNVLLRAITVRNFVATGDPRHQRDYERLLSRHAGLLDGIERMPLDPESGAAIAALSAASRQHVARTTVFLSLFGSAAIPRELAEAESRLADARADLLSQIRAFDELQHRRQEAARARMSDAEREVWTAMLATALLVAVALGLTAVLTTRAVRRPALALMAAARAVERGDYAPALELALAPGARPPGELQALGAAFARMADALRRREQKTEADGRLAAALAGSLDPEATARSALEEIAAYTRADVAAVYLVADGALRRVAGRASGGTPETLPLSGIVAQALASGRAVALGDVPADLPLELHVGFGAIRPRSVVAVPLASGGAPIGVLLLGSLRPTSAEAAAFAESAAGHLGIALHNALSHARIGGFAAELRDRNERLQAQNDELHAQAEEIQAQSEELVAQGDEIRRRNEELAYAKEALAAKAGALEEVDRRKNEFLATLGHELRNPLAAVATAGRLLEASSRDAPSVMRHAAVISRQARNLRRLVDDLLDLSRINHGKIDLRLERIDLGAAIDGAILAIRPEADAKAQRVSFRLGAEALSVDADPTRLEQILSNLLRNAVKYTPPEGTITVAAEVEGPEAVIRVGDTGMGISSELLPRIFEPFIQGTHSECGEQGLGLGLALVRRLVELHEGSVEARSDGEGAGTVFVVRLPLAAPVERPGAGELPGKYREDGDGRRRVLVVEDNPDVAETMAEALLMFGFAVRVEGDAYAGLRACIEAPPDVALLDIGLPGRSGYELARDIRARLPASAVRLVAVTGYGQPDDREHARAAGFDRHLVKPVDLEELRDVIERLAALGDEIGAAA